jgi:hypothetical protein
MKGEIQHKSQYELHNETQWAPLRTSMTWQRRPNSVYPTGAERPSGALQRRSNSVYPTVAERRSNLVCPTAHVPQKTVRLPCCPRGRVGVGVGALESRTHPTHSGGPTNQRRVLGHWERQTRFAQGSGPGPRSLGWVAGFRPEICLRTASFASAAPSRPMPMPKMSTQLYKGESIVASDDAIAVGVTTPARRGARWALEGGLGLLGLPA